MPVCWVAWATPAGVTSGSARRMRAESRPTASRGAAAGDDGAARMWAVLAAAASRHAWENSMPAPRCGCTHGRRGQSTRRAWEASTGTARRLATGWAGGNGNDGRSGDWSGDWSGDLSGDWSGDWSGDGRLPGEGERVVADDGAGKLGQQRQQPAAAGWAFAQALQGRFVQGRAGGESSPGGGQPRAGDAHLAFAVRLAGRGIPDDDLSRAGVEHEEGADTDRRLTRGGEAAQVRQHAREVRTAGRAF